MKTGRIVVVTGAAGGMGKLFVQRFLAHGDTVIATDTGEEGLAKLSAELGGDRLFTRAADISSEHDTLAVADLARDKAGRIDVTPGLTVTAAVKKLFSEEILERAVEARAIRREEKAEDLVGAVFFLASPDADFLSGQTLNVDGGGHMT